MDALNGGSSYQTLENESIFADFIDGAKEQKGR